MALNKKPAVINVGGVDIQLINQTPIYGVTDSIHFATYAASVTGAATIGTECQCGGGPLSNIIAKEDGSVPNPMVILKCYNCKKTFIAPQIREVRKEQ